MKTFHQIRRRHLEVYALPFSHLLYKCRWWCGELANQQRRERSERSYPCLYLPYTTCPVVKRQSRVSPPGACLYDRHAAFFSCYLKFQKTNVLETWQLLRNHSVLWSSYPKCALCSCQTAQWYVNVSFIFLYLIWKKCIHLCAFMVNARNAWHSLVVCWHQIKVLDIRKH